MKSKGCGEAFGGGEGVLIAVEGEKSVGLQLQGGGNVKDVETAMPAHVGAGFGEAFSNGEDCGYIPVDELKHPFIEMLAQLGDNALGFGVWKPLASILSKSESLKPGRLAKFPQKQAGNLNWSSQVVEIQESPFGIILIPIKRAKKRGVSGDLQLKSPSSASRISRTSSAEKTRSPQVSFNQRRCASASKTGDFFDRPGGDKCATGLPCLVISISSPSASHSSTLAKSYRKSRTVSVFMNCDQTIHHKLPPVNFPSAA